MLSNTTLVRVPATRKPRTITLAREASQSSGMPVFVGLLGYAATLSAGMTALLAMVMLVH